MLLCGAGSHLSPFLIKRRKGVFFDSLTFRFINRCHKHLPFCIMQFPFLPRSSSS